MPITVKPLFVLPIAGLLLLSACDTVGVLGPREGVGVGVGAAAGAALGAAIPGNRLATGAAGAVGGALVGGLIGSALDQQAGELRNGFGDPRIQVINTGSYLKVIMPEAILFATDSATVSPALYGQLDVLAQHLRKYPESTVQVVGHTDSTGSDAYNQQLSQQRANSVTSVLSSNGVGAARLQAVGQGESQPIASNATVEGRAQNRRVEINIYPR